MLQLTGEDGKIYKRRRSGGYKGVRGAGRSPSYTINKIRIFLCLFVCLFVCPQTTPKEIDTYR